MKIALVSPYDYPYPGGVVRHIFYLDKEFRRLGHDVRIIAACSEDVGDVPRQVIKVSGSIAHIPFAGSVGRITLSPRVYRRVKKILKREQFDESISMSLWHRLCPWLFCDTLPCPPSP